MTTIFVLLIILVISFFNNKEKNKEKNKKKSNKLSEEEEVAFELLNKRINLEFNIQKLETLVDDKTDIYHLKQDENFIDFIKCVSAKYTQYMNKWVIQDAEVLQTLDRYKVNDNILAQELSNCMRLIRENNSVVEEITNLYNESQTMLDKAKTIGINYYETKINEINKKNKLSSLKTL